MINIHNMVHGEVYNLEDSCASRLIVIKKEKAWPEGRSKFK